MTLDPVLGNARVAVASAGVQAGRSPTTVTR